MYMENFVFMLHISGHFSLDLFSLKTNTLMPHLIEFIPVEMLLSFSLESYMVLLLLE